MKYLKDQKGAALVLELVLLAVVLVVAGFAGYQYMKNAKAVSKTATPIPHKANTPSPTPNPYVGWNNYSLKYERISFKYPSNWTIKDQTATTQVTDSQGQPLYSPGSDAVILTSPDYLTINIITAPYTEDFGGPHTLVSSTPIKMLGSTYYLDFSTVTANGSTINGDFEVVTKSADLGQDPSSFPPSRNITLGPGSHNPAIQNLPAPYDLIAMFYDQPNSTNHDPLSKYQQDPNFSTAEKILESMTY